jgi:hypothetical protein
MAERYRDDERVRADGLIGVLLDVSDSMRSAYAADSSQDASVERTHAIFTTIVKIVKREVVRHDREEKIFASAFGISHESTDCCDLLHLLDLLRNSPDDGYRALIDLAKREGVADRIEPWLDDIKENLSSVDARLLYAIMKPNPSMIRELSRLIPSRYAQVGLDAHEGGAKALGFITKVFTLGWFQPDLAAKAHESRKITITDSDAYMHAQKIISVSLKRPLEPNPIQYVSEMLDDVFSIGHGYDDSVHARIQKFIEVIKPYIFGSTPMRKALEDAFAVFKEKSGCKQVLFIVSDGSSSDGDPLPIAERLRSMGVVMATCYLTSSSIPNPKKLYDKTDSTISQCRDGRNVLFQMSSVLENTQPPITNLVDAEWELSPSGESCLFFQANSLDVVNEFCETVIAQMTMSCDALVDLVGKVDLATLINQENAQFKAKEQKFETCYANAIAAVFYLAMHRIVGRKGGHPDFCDIRERIVDEYGYEGAYTDKVLKNVSGEYRLHCVEVDGNGAREALNERRPVVARFIWYEEEVERFNEFFRKSPKGTLRKNDLRGVTGNKESGHAVVMMRISPRGITFMNSWGQKFANGGFFSVENEDVLRGMKFYDVYWLETELKQSEKEAYDRECSKKCGELAQAFPSIIDLPFVCPECNHESLIREFSGHALNAQCPKYCQSFKPTNKQLIESLYIQAHKPVKQN